MNPRRAFSLIEVLIGIVVLALGLLGLAAVFPAVIVQQRSTTDSVQSTTLARSVRDLLRGNSVFNKVSIDAAPVEGYLRDNELRGWMTLVGDSNWMTPPGRTKPWDIPVIGGGAPGLVLDNDGTVHVQGAVATGNPGTTPGFNLAPEDRTIRSNSQQPFLWDFAARRIASGRPYSTDTAAYGNNIQQISCQDDRIQLAVFIRRVDTVPAGRTPANPVLIAVDANGVPTQNGDGSFSAIDDNLRFTPDADDPTRIVRLTLPNAPLKPLVVQVGQKLVSPWGTVHTIKAIRSYNNGEVELNPKLDRGELVRLPSALRRFLYTPQIPIAVTIVDLQPQKR